jgi:hypothetical protein
MKLKATRLLLQLLNLRVGFSKQIVSGLGREGALKRRAHLVGLAQQSCFGRLWTGRGYCWHWSRLHRRLIRGLVLGFQFKGGNAFLEVLCGRRILPL